MNPIWQDEKTGKWHYQAPNLLVCGPFATQGEAQDALEACKKLGRTL